MSNRNIPLTPQLTHRNPYQHLLSSAHHQSFSQPSDEPPSISPNDILTITNNQIHQLVHRHQKFVTVICMLIDTTQKQIASDSIANALQVLKITEKILEYAASCGKNLQKKLIFHVLHNLACAYQKFWDLEHCSNYLQALIYNANEKFGVTSSITESTISKQKSSNNNISKQESIMNTFPESQICPSLQQIKKSIIMPKLNIGEQIRNIKYNLQIAAINSQLKNHLKSSQYGENGIRLLHELFATLNNHITNRDKQISHLNINSKIRSEVFSHSFLIIRSVNNSNHVITTDNYTKYQEICQYLLKNWIGFQTRNRELFEELSSCKDIKQFTIGYVMQLKTYVQELNETQMTETKNREYELYSMVPDLISICNNQKIVKYVLLLSIAHFTKATELRLHSRFNQNLYESQNMRSSNQQSLFLAECYHLYAMILYFIYIPVKLDLINHIVSSYLREYNDSINLDELFNRSSQIKKQGQILIDRLIMNKKKAQSKDKVGSHNNEELSSDAVRILKQIDPEKLHTELRLQYLAGQDKFSIGKSQQLYTNQSQFQNINGYQKEKLIQENIEQVQQSSEQKGKMKSIQKRYKGIINKKFNFEEQVQQIHKTPRNKSFTRLRKRESSNMHKSALNLHKGKFKKSSSKLKLKKSEMNHFRKADKAKIRNMLDEVFKDTQEAQSTKKPKATNQNKSNKKNYHSNSFIEAPQKKKNQKSEKKRIQKNGSQKSISNGSSKNDGGCIKGLKSKGKINNLKSPKKMPRNSYHQYFC